MALYSLPTSTALLLAASILSAQAGPPVFIDLASDTFRQIVVDREDGQYLGHPTTCLLEDGKTMLCVYPKGHGRGAIVYKRSSDGGLTWSDRLPTPASWATSKEVPTLHRVIDTAGKKRIVMFSGLHPVRMAVTEDDGQTWSELKPVGDWGGIVTTTYGHWESGRQPWIVSVRLTIDELDEKARTAPKLSLP